MVTKKTKEPLFDMPQEVKNWIEQANSRLKHMQSEIDRLKQENVELKAYRKFAEHKITRSEAE
jgi:cell shape-determining protein MreC